MIPIVEISNYDQALLEIRRLIPDSVNCDGLAIVYSQGPRWSANITVINTTFPSPQDEANSLAAKALLQRSFDRRGVIRSVHRLILKLPSGIISKWQVQITPYNPPSSSEDEQNSHAQSSRKDGDVLDKINSSVTNSAKTSKSAPDKTNPTMTNCTKQSSSDSTKESPLPTKVSKKPYRYIRTYRTRTFTSSTQSLDSSDSEASSTTQRPRMKRQAMSMKTVLPAPYSARELRTMAKQSSPLVKKLYLNQCDSDSDYASLSDMEDKKRALTVADNVKSVVDHPLKAQQSVKTRSIQQHTKDATDKEETKIGTCIPPKATYAISELQLVDYNLHLVKYTPEVLYSLDVVHTCTGITPDTHPGSRLRRESKLRLAVGNLLRAGVTNFLPQSAGRMIEIGCQKTGLSMQVIRKTRPAKNNGYVPYVTHDYCNHTADVHSS